MLDFNKLDVLDPPDVDQTEFGPDMKRWLANIVDVINYNFIILNTVTSYFENLITAQGLDVGGGGSSVNVPVIGLTANGFVTATLISSTNPVEISSITPNLNFFNITFSSNPGASAIIVYQAFITQPNTEI